MSRQREAERVAQQATAVGAVPVANTITLNKPIQVKIKYRMATIPAGTTLPIVSRDANRIVIEYAGENVPFAA